MDLHPHNNGFAYRNVEVKEPLRHELVEETVEMIDIRKEWKQTNEKGKLTGCGIHRNFTFDDIFSLKNSLKEIRSMAGLDEAKEENNNKKKKKHFCSQTEDTDWSKEFPADMFKNIANWEEPNWYHGGKKK
jgi:hypothetical protein